MYFYAARAADPDDDLLSYRLILGPRGMTINEQTGGVMWRPTVRQVGNHPVTVLVTDGQGSDLQSFAIRVIPIDNGVPFQRGFTLVSWWNDSYLQPATEASLIRMREDGCEWVSILVTWYQPDVGSTVMSAHPLFTQTDESLIHAIAVARSVGLKVVLKPHIDLLSGGWRGDINFTDEADWRTWRGHYDEFLGHYLDLAEANQVSAVIIGTELAGTEGREADWRATIALARTRFSGRLTYGANHSTFFGVPWWDDLDYIGVSAYFGLTSGYTPTVEELVNAWSQYRQILRGVAALYDLDVVFTEIGYMSRDGANIAPWDYWLATAPDLQEQADCYQAALEALYNEPWFKGMYWWAWTSDPSGDNNGYDIYNKPAETVLRDWYAGDL